MAGVTGEKLNKLSYIEGIGNEVLLSFVAAVAIFLPIIIVVVVRKNRNLQIHPGEAEHVQETRERLGIGNVDENADESENSEERQRQVPPRNLNDGEPCPICLMQPRLLVITNCGHGFCGLCLTTYWQTRTSFRAMTCPVCRQQVTMIFMDFPEANTTEEARNIRNSVNQYNRRFSSEPRTIMEFIQDLPTLLQQLFNEFFSITGLVTVLRVRIIFCFVAAILYFLSPIDILPEAAFGILGFFDDIVVFLLLLVYVTEVYRNFVANRAAAALM